MPADLPGLTAAAGWSAPDHPAGRRPGPVVERLTGLDARAFGARHWGREPLLVRGADAARFGDLLTLDGVDELLSGRGLRTPFVRLVRNGALVGSGSFTGSGGVGAEIGDQVRDDKVAALFADGSTVVLQALHRTWSPVAELATALGAELGHPVQVNAYVTPASSRGFSAHYDVHDVLVLQVAGRKHWTVHRPVHADPLRDQPWNDHAGAVAQAADEEPAIDVVLDPGDVLYLPRGWLHAATALGEVSAHLTVGVHVVTRYAIVEALTAAVADDPRLRSSLPLGIDLADAAHLAPHVDAVRAALHDAIDAVPVAELARRVRGRTWQGARAEPVRPLATAAFLAGLGPGDAVRVRAGLGHHIGIDPDGRVLLELPDRTVTLPSETAAAVHTLVRDGVATVGNLPGMDGPDQIVLVRRLLKEGVLVPASPP